MVGYDNCIPVVTMCPNDGYDFRFNWYTNTKKINGDNNNKKK